jgi:hypothetical protein
MGVARERFGLIPWLSGVVLLAGVAWLFVDRPPAFSQTRPESGAGPVVLELFTSEGCSSCPPADALLSEIGSSTKGVIPLAYHVDYWNHLGWSDPFSSREFSARQEAYSRAMNLGGEYTPQVVIEGQSQYVGSDRRGIASAVAAASEGSAEGRVTLNSTVDGEQPRAIHIKVSAELPAPGAGGSHELVLAIFENGLVSDIGAGENSGRKITYDYTVRKLLPVLDLEALHNSPIEKEFTVDLDPSWSVDHLGVAAFIQNSESLRIVAAASQYPVAKD